MVWKYYIDDIFPYGTKIYQQNYPTIILDTHFKQTETSSQISLFVTHQFLIMDLSKKPWEAYKQILQQKTFDVNISTFKKVLKDG